MAVKSEEWDPFARARSWRKKLVSKGWWHSFELPDGTQIDGVNTLASMKSRLGQFPIPEDLRGKRVLDIGAWDGWFTFEMERRGADVMAVDNWDNPRFHEMHARLGSRAEYRQLDMYELTPERIGRFDIVLFMGVLYHLKHPLLGLERVCSLTTDMAAVDSFVLREEHRPGENVESRPFMEFYETDELGGQPDNWVGPNLQCLLAFCRTAGFARVELQSVIEDSACIACYRHWEPPPAEAPAGPEISDILHTSNGGINFRSQSDEYITAFFESSATHLTLDNVKPQVGGYGSRPLVVARLAEHLWQANFKLPPGLTPGWHEVRVRTGDSLPSDARRVAVDLVLESGPIRIAGVRDARTGTPNQVDLSQGDWLSFWIVGLPENADRNNVRVSLDGVGLQVTYVGAANSSAPCQVNAAVPQGIERGVARVSVAVGENRSDPFEIVIL